MHSQISIRNLLVRQLILDIKEQHRQQHSKKAVLSGLNPRTVNCSGFCSLEVQRKVQKNIKQSSV